MKKNVSLVSMLLLLIISACRKEEQAHISAKGVTGPTVVLPSGYTLPAIVAAGETCILQSGGTYYLNGKTYVDSLGTIVIRGGVTIKGVKKSNPSEASALVVTAGGKIYAQGTPDSVIVFTSNEPVPAPGDWGGVIILGHAQTNQKTSIMDGVNIPMIPSGINMYFGSERSDFNTESSGLFSYVRIEYPGAFIAVDVPLSGLTLGGVGSGTIIDHVQCSYALGDAFKFLGGAVNARYLIALNPRDDMFDFTFGYTGRLQFLLGLRRAGYTYADASGVEAENDAFGTTLVPRTLPQISNMTLIGGFTVAYTGTLDGIRLRKNTGYLIKNAVVLGYNTGVSFEGGLTVADVSRFNNNVVHGFTSAFTGVTAVPASNYLAISANSNAQILLENPFAQGTNFRPYPVNPGTPAGSGASFTELGPGFFTVVTYKGAFPPGSKEWINTWTAGL